MKPEIPFIVIVFVMLVAPALADDKDSRQLVELPPQMRQHMLANMRDHLQAIAEIHNALSSANFDKAADIAENRLGMSSLTSHGASHMATFMPKEMQSIGTQMHRSASQFAVIAQESAVDGNLKRAIEGLAQVTQHCVSCHAAYRVH
ncbi:hypothetical protein [Kaarinaea lacus]